MNKQLSIILAMTGAILVAASQAQAQSNTYNNEDLLLNFRNFSSQSDPNLTIDFGNVNTFVTTVAGLAGSTAVLDTGAGFTATLSTGFSYAGLTALLGAPSTGNVIAFSAAAADSSGSGLLFLTRTQSSASLTPPSFPSAQQTLTAQASTAEAIDNIGLLTQTGSPTTTILAGSGANAESYASGNANSYQSQAQDSGNPSEIDYGGSQSVASHAGGVLESQVTGSADVYEALWEVPVKGTGSDTYEGYFTFQPDGEIDFTTVASVPEPSTYVLLVVTGVAGLAFRRQIRSLIA